MIWQAAEAGEQPGRELVLLLLASIVAVLALLLAIAGARMPALLGAHGQSALLFAIAAAGAAIAALIGYAAMRQAPLRRASADETAELRKELLTAEAIIKAEPQVLILWEQGRGVHMIVHTLTGIAGLPQGEGELLKFGRWLDPLSAQDLKRHLDALFGDGEPFSVLLKTSARAHLEADGRAAGERVAHQLAVLVDDPREVALAAGDVAQPQDRAPAGGPPVGLQVGAGRGLQ